MVDKQSNLENNNISDFCFFKIADFWNESKLFEVL
jgi:hypothetical protein